MIVQEIITFITIAVVLMLSIMSILLLIKIKSLPYSSVKFFIWAVCIGMVSYAAGEVLHFFSGRYPSVADLFYSAGTFLFLLGFYHIYDKKEKKVLTKKDRHMILFISIFTIGVLSYMSSIVMPRIHDYNIFEVLLNFYYPLASAFIIMFAFLFQVHSGERHGFIFYIMIFGFFSYVCDVIYVFTSNAGASGVIRDMLFLVGYLFLLLGLVLFYKRMKRTTSLVIE